MQQGPVWVFSKAAIREALAHLIGHLPIRSAPAPEGHNNLSLSSATRMVTAVAITLPEMLRSLQSGQLASFRLSDDVSLATLRIERVYIEAFLAERRGRERGDMLALDTVRRLLHCSAMSLQRWHASKLLVPSQEETIGSKRRWWYRRQDVLTFIGRYISVHEASALLGCTSLTLQSWTRAGILPAVSGPHVDGVHSYRFDKAFLTQWRQQRMISREVAERLGISKPTLYRWVNQGKLTSLDEGKKKHRWFAKEEIVRYNKSSSRNASVPAGRSALAQ
jgi:excisionase family DNA binding protein